VGIYEVLKDEQKRARYDRILEEGMPDWRSGIYYFRRVRKLSIREISIALAIIISIGHYFVLWAQHFEKKLTLEDHMDDVKKKLEKKQKKKKAAPKLDEIDSSLQKYYDELESPTFKHTLPYRFVMWAFSVAVNLPTISKDVWGLLTKKRQVTVVDADDSDDEYDRQQAEIEERRRQRIQKNSQDLNPKKIEKSDTNAVSYSEKKDDESSAIKASSVSAAKSKEWSDKEKSDLIKAIVKFPAGTVNRWNKIAETLERSVNDCVNMEKLIKSSMTSTAHSQLNASTWSSSSSTANGGGKVSITEEPTMSEKYLETNGTETVEKCVWSQDHQKLFEKALKEIGKDVPNRWEKIAESVPGKTKVF
jgi:DnaJ family protein C protein 1